MTQQKHIIQKHIFDLECDQYEAAHSLQKRLLSLIHNTLPTLCEDVLHNCDLPGIHLKIPQLVLDLGDIPEDRFESEFILRYRRVLQEQLDRLIQETKAGTNQEVVMLPQAHSVADMWVHLLLDGYLPWWGNAAWENFAPGIVLTPKNVFLQLWKQSQQRLLTFLKANFQNTAFRKRLIHQLDDSTLLEFSLHLTSLGHSFLQKTSAHLPQGLREIFWETVLEMLLVESRSIHSKNQAAFWTLLSDKLVKNTSSIQLFEPKNNLPLEKLLLSFQEKLLLSSQQKSKYLILEKLIHSLWQKQNILFQDQLSVSQIQTILKILFQSQFREIQELIKSLITEFKHLKTIELRVWEAAFQYLWYEPTRSPGDIDKEELQRVIRLELQKSSPTSSESQAKSKSESESKSETSDKLLKLWMESADLEEFIHISTWQPSIDSRKEFLNRVLPLYRSFMDRFLQIILQIFQENQLSADSPQQIEAKIWQQSMQYLWNKRRIPFQSQDFMQEMTKIIFKLYPQVPTESFIELLRSKIPMAEDLQKSKEPSKQLDLEEFIRQSPDHEEDIPALLQESGLLPWKTLIRRVYALTHFESARENYQPWQEQLSQRSADPAITQYFLESKTPNLDLFLHYLYYFILEGQLPEKLSITPSVLLAETYSRFPEALKLFFAALSPPEKLVLRRANANIIHQIMAQLNRETQQKKLEALGETLKKNALKFGSTEAIYIQNAGLVILHPYISRLFKLLEYTENQNFKSRETAFRAAYLLQYLATKKTETQEYEMVFNKILCGIPLNEVLPTEIELQEQEKETAEGMLRGIISNWTALKNTDPDNLRVSFLIREGKITAQEKSWNLHVEERGFDVLLDYLPWSIGTVRLPWMDKILFTQWRGGEN